MGLDNAGRYSDRVTLKSVIRSDDGDNFTDTVTHLVHLVVVGLQGGALGLGVLVGDCGLAQGLPRGLVLVQVDPGLLAVPVHLHLAHGGEILDKLGHLSIDQ